MAVYTNEIESYVTGRKARTKGKSLLTRFIGWLNNHLNPAHDWMDYDAAPDPSSGGLENFWKGVTGTGLTQRDIAMNEMNMQNVEDTAAAQVAGYQKAGVNPALMYGSGASNSAPQASDTGMSGNMSELMQLIMLPMQMKMLNAQAKNIDANTQKQISETDQIKQVMQFYPRLTEHQIAEIVSRQGLNISNMNKADAETAILQFEKIIKSAEADESSAYYKARREYEEAKSVEAKAAAAAHAAQAAWTTYQKEFTEQHNGAMPSSSSILALVEAISSWLGVSPEGATSEVSDAVTRAVASVTGEKPKNGNTMQSLGRHAAGEPWRIKGKTLVEHGKSAWNRFKKFMNNNSLSRF